MATVLVHIRVRAGAEREFERLSRSLYLQTHRDEPNVRRYEYWRGAEPGLYYALISYDDFDGFLAHQTSAHHEAASPELGKVIETLELEWVDPIAEASPLTPSDMSPLRDDASELAVRYHKRFAIEVKDWWLNMRRS